MENEIKKKKRRKSVSDKKFVLICWTATKTGKDINWVAQESNMTLVNCKMRLEKYRQAGVAMPYNIRGHQK